MGVVVGIVIAIVVGLGLGAAATVVLVETNAPDRQYEASFESGDFKEGREVVQYGQR